MKLIIQNFENRKKINLLMVPEGHAESVQLAEIKMRALGLGLDHWDSDTDGWKDWTKADEWGFNLVLTKEIK